MKRKELQKAQEASSDLTEQSGNRAKIAYVFTANTQEIRNQLKGPEDIILEISARDTLFSACTPERAIDMALSDSYAQYAKRIVMRKPAPGDKTDVYFCDTTKRNTQPMKIGTLHCVQ